MFHSIRWRIAVPYVGLILAITLGLTLYVSNQMRQARLDNLETQLLADARLLTDSIELMQPDEGETWDTLSKTWAAALGARVTLIAADGMVLGESHEDRAQMGNHLYRPEVQQALASGQGSSIRFSQTVGYEMMYVATLAPGKQEVAIVRVALPLRQIEADVSRLRKSVLVAGLLAALLGALLALFIAERTARPVYRLTDVAVRLAEGDLNAHLLPTTRDEIGRLTDAFNYMAAQIREKVSTLAGERARLAAVLAHMSDGVLITDKTGRVRLINPAAAQLLGTSVEKALHQTFAQTVRYHQIIELWQECLRQGQQQDQIVEIRRQDLFLQVIVTPFQEVEWRGCLVILQDLTRIRRLETVRRDFISNISHELRTPLAGLKTLVDTLRDGALDDPPAARHFLDRMDIELDTLIQMVQELLELSRIESGKAPLRLEMVAVADVILGPVDRLLPQAERAGLTLSVDLPSALPPIRADSERMQQVIVNLVHNAIKFTPSGGQVTVSAERIDDELVITVRDTGVGVPAADLPRIFERFYKSYRTRSDGSGLGLAIARHIVLGHGGRIWVESVERRGSTFYLSLPVAT